jgi:Spy/CpxP family protein refolding chaperone
VKSKLAALRDARKARQEKLAAAQEELKKVLTARQEAVAVLNGLLE